MKRFLTGALLLSSAAFTPLMAKVAVKTPFEHVQPDGSTITYFLHGDEHCHFITTSDGKLLTKHPSSGIVYASIDADGLPVASSVTAHNLSERNNEERLFLEKIGDIDLVSTATRLRRKNKRPEATRSLSAEDYRLGLFSDKYPLKGSPKALIILVEYKDVSFSLDDPYDYFNRMLNEKGFADNGATGSVSDWFEYNSRGEFTPDFDVLGPVVLPKERSYYGANDRMGNDRNPEQMVLHAMEALDDSVDFSQYDTDKDGFIDNVFVFYAGYGEADSDLEYTVWPHSYNISYAQPGKTYTFDGVVVDKYACSNEIDYVYKRTDGIGTFVHEFSHVMGLPDLYPTTYTSSFTPGSYSVLDYGPYNNQGRTPPNYSAFELNALGWLTPEFMTENGEYTLENLSESHKCFLVPTENQNEFFLLENRQKTGNDKFIPAQGMIVWHIDYDYQSWYNNTVNNTPDHMRVRMILADNRATESTRTGDVFPGKAKVTSFTPSTKPAFVDWNKKPVGVSINDIDLNEGIISFNAELDLTGIESTEINTAEGFRINGMNIHALNPLCIYDITGRSVATLNAGESLTIPNKGIMIISSEGKTVKHAF